MHTLIEPTRARPRSVRPALTLAVKAAEPAHARQFLEQRGRAAGHGHGFQIQGHGGLSLAQTGKVVLQGGHGAFRLPTRAQ